MILEGIVTTLDEDDAVRIAPMGPKVQPGYGQFVLRPFTTSRTFENIKRTGQGVFHVTDDVELIAQAAIDRLSEMPRVHAAKSIKGMILTDACRWYAFRVDSICETEIRATVPCRVVESGFQREFFGLCRAKHAVVETAILATRVHLLDDAGLRADLTSLAPLVEKTGGESERRAFELLRSYILHSLETSRYPESGD